MNQNDKSTEYYDMLGLSFCLQLLSSLQFSRQPGNVPWAFGAYFEAHTVLSYHTTVYYHP